jgi:hypothetical protein
MLHLRQVRRREAPLCGRSEPTLADGPLTGRFVVVSTIMRTAVATTEQTNTSRPIMVSQGSCGAPRSPRPSIVLLRGAVFLPALFAGQKSKQPACRQLDFGSAASGSNFRAMPSIQ